MNTFFVIGFMGCGKSYWGKKWADKYGLTFFEMDEMIETAEGKSIAAIFEENGEAYFRQQEKQMLHTLITNNNCIVSTGGGTPCFFDNMQLMNSSGTTIYLKATPQLLTSRLQTEKAKRPVIQSTPDGELETFIKSKLQERILFYEQAKYVLDAGVLTISSLDEVLGHL